MTLWTFDLIESALLYYFVNQCDSSIDVDKFFTDNFSAFP